MCVVWVCAFFSLHDFVINNRYKYCELVTCEGLLAGGTTSGHVGLWKYCPAPGMTEPEDQWQSQPHSSVTGPVVELEVYYCYYHYYYFVPLVV